MIDSIPIIVDTKGEDSKLVRVFCLIVELDYPNTLIQNLSFPEIIIQTLTTLFESFILGKLDGGYFEKDQDIEELFSYFEQKNLYINTKSIDLPREWFEYPVLRGNVYRMNLDLFSMIRNLENYNVVDRITNPIIIYSSSETKAFKSWCLKNFNNE